jgi:hypothetical protein
MIPKPATDCASICSTSLTVVVSVRSNGDVIRPTIWSGGSPVYCHTTLITGILISGKMSVGVFIADKGPMMRMKIARTTKV